MKLATNQYNAGTIEKELQWFQQLLTLRTKITFERSEREETFLELRPPSTENDSSDYAQLINDHDMGAEERLVLLLAVLPHVRPSLLDILHLKNTLYDVPFTEFGGVAHERHKGFLPTGETAMFLLAGEHLERRLQLMSLFDHDHFFAKEGILFLQGTHNERPLLYGVITLSQEYVAKLTVGNDFRPEFGSNFPARCIHTDQEEDDLIVSAELKAQLADIKNYINHGKALKRQYHFGKKIQPGYKVLFTGPPGTGKTMSATLLGKTTGMQVYRIDLSLVVSKYIGETEKNLSRIFDMAENKDWILFFDEADALFGKRSSVSDAHDRYANQEVSFLLQRMEDFDGLVILCSNFKKNIDEAFFRRFHLVLDFALPNAHQRYVLWSKSKTDAFTYGPKVDLTHLAEAHELSAAAIINILHYCILKCLGRDDTVIRWEDIQAALKIESVKEGRTII